ncbi:MAG: UDP-N-acetylmuramoyl-L-alanyl-D-glutamate--2,6-diaminopimelate ligase, partial [Candidatus Omnitrophota bacterium]
SDNIKCIGITGTTGKTTISYLFYIILTTAWHSVGIVGTINYRVGKRIIPATNTTPGPIELHNFMNEMVRNSIDFVAMEVSSHSLDQRRVEGIKYAVGIFTNLTGDHLDYHRTYDEYFDAKAKLFEGLDDGSYAVINVDDEWGRKLLKRSKGKITTYGIKSDAEFLATCTDLSLGGTKFVVEAPNRKMDISTKLIGLHNIYNITASIAAGVRLGLPLDLIKVGVENIVSVPGRLEAIDCGQPFKVFVDYAHTDDALYNVLFTLKPLISKRIIVVFGCGGERDRTKRPRMGRVASEFTDYIIVTSDNPRSEEPESIAKEIVGGIENREHTIILDREQAINEALSKAKEGDCVLIAGKGHETYQVFKDRTVPFDDREVTRKILCLMLRRS